MLDRFYVPEGLERPQVELSREEAHHLVSVLRKRPGDPVMLFDGRGAQAEGRVAAVGKRTASIDIVRRWPLAPRTSPHVLLATASPKGERVKWLIEKATELGAARWTPLHTARGIVQPGETRLDKLRQTVIAACKQCGRNDLLEIDPPAEWSQWLPSAVARGPVLVAHPSGRSPESVLTEIRGVISDGQSVSVAIGPEGGFTEEEIVRAIDAGGRAVNLGATILRIETAAIAVLAWLRLSAGSQA